MRNKILLLLVLICTVFLTIYPANQLYHKYQTQQQVNVLERKIAEKRYPSKEAVEKAVQKALEETKEDNQANVPANTKEAVADQETPSNQTVSADGQQEQTKQIVTDVFSETSRHDFEPATYSGAVGYIYIPKINSLEMLYLGASQENLRQGVAQMSQTSLPLSGIGHQTVIAGHRGGYSSAEFLYIDQLKAGDHIYIDYLGNKAVYSVTQLDVIKNYGQNETLTDIPNLDMLTLYTCHPYPQNYERLLVRSLRDESAVFHTPQSYSTSYKYKKREVEVPNEPTYTEQVETFNQTPELVTSVKETDSNGTRPEKSTAKAEDSKIPSDQNNAIDQPQTASEKISRGFTSITNKHQTFLLMVWVVVAGLWSIRILVLLLGEFRGGTTKV